MAEVIKMPRMSDTMTEGVIVSWLKKVGDTVKSGDILAEVETDKATMELESYTDGVLLHIGVIAGEAVPVDGVIAVIGKAGEAFEGFLENKPTEKANDATSQPVSASMPAIDSISPATKAVSEPIKEPVAEETDAINTTEGGRVIASPLAKMIASEKGIPIERVTGSGDHGRIVKRDVENFVPGRSEIKTQLPAKSANLLAGTESYTDVPVSQMRKTIAKRLAESKFSAPHFYLTIEVNMGRATLARKSMNDFLGSKVSFNDIIIRASAAALRKHPKVNGSWLGDKLRYYDHIHIGVAIAVEEGLLVPVIRFADTKSISDISTEVKHYAELAKAKKLQPADFTGNTFTISNLGMFGIEDFTAIINPPDACILAVGAIQEKAIVENGEIKIGQMMKLTLSCDHRIVDGATGAQFLQTLKQFLEEPVIILA